MTSDLRHFQFINFAKIFSPLGATSLIHVRLQIQAAPQRGIPEGPIPHEMEFRVKPDFLRVLRTLDDIDRRREIFTYLDVSANNYINLGNSYV